MQLLVVWLLGVLYREETPVVHANKVGWKGCLTGIGQQNLVATENKTGFLLILDSADLNLRGLANVQLLSFWQQVKIIQTEVEYLLAWPAGHNPAPSVSFVALLRFHT